MTADADTADALIARLQAQARTQSVSYQGAQMHWRAWGKGAPLVMLHGGHGSWLHWVRNIEALADAGYTVWLPDLPGFGDSDLPPAPGDFASFLAMVGATLQAVVGTGAPVNLAGFSFGGLVAAELAASAAARHLAIRRLALLGPGGHGGARRQPLEMLNWRKADSPQALEAALRNNLASLMLHQPDSIDALAVQVQARASAATRFRSKPISRSAALGPALAHITCPTLLAWGEHDVTADPVLVGPAMQARQPGLQLRIVPGAGHWVQYEAAPATLALLTDWFR